MIHVCPCYIHEAARPLLSPSLCLPTCPPIYLRFPESGYRLIVWWSQHSRHIYTRTVSHRAAVLAALEHRPFVCSTRPLAACRSFKVTSTFEGEGQGQHDVNETFCRPLSVTSLRSDVSSITDSSA